MYALYSVLLNLQHTTEPGIVFLESPRNPLLKEVRRAVERGTLTASGMIVAETFHLVEEALSSGRPVSHVIARQSAADAAARFAHNLVIVPDDVFRTLAATETSQGIMALVEPPPQSLDTVLDGRTLAVVLDGIQDPGNAGAILRATEAFGATGAVFLKGTVSPYNPKAVRASAGSIFRLPVVSGTDPQTLLDALAARGCVAYSAMPRARKLAAETDFVRPCVLVVGSEGKGVGEPMESASQGVRIPTSRVESLNAAVAVGVLLYEAARQRASQ